MNALSLISTGLAGLTAAEASLNVAASSLVNASSSPAPANSTPLVDPRTDSPDADLASGVVHLILAKHLYSASAQIVRTADHLLGTLLDVIEMLCDWKAATMRHADGDLGKSIRINAERYGFGPEIEALLRNTAHRMGWLLQGATDE